MCCLLLQQSGNEMVGEGGEGSSDVAYASDTELDVLGRLQDNNMACELRTAPSFLWVEVSAV